MFHPCFSSRLMIMYDFAWILLKFFWVSTCDRLVYLILAIDLFISFWIRSCNSYRLRSFETLQLDLPILLSQQGQSLFESSPRRTGQWSAACWFTLPRATYTGSDFVPERAKTSRRYFGTFHSNLCQYLSNCAPTPPLTQQQSTDNKQGLMLGQGRSRCAVGQILTLSLSFCGTVLCSMLVWSASKSMLAQMKILNSELR